jgi:hypothetical protein
VIAELKDEILSTRFRLTLTRYSLRASAVVVSPDPGADRPVYSIYASVRILSDSKITPENAEFQVCRKLTRKQ